MLNNTHCTLLPPAAENEEPWHRDHPVVPLPVPNREGDSPLNHHMVAFHAVGKPR